jgi:hypothetical protein
MLSGLIICYQSIKCHAQTYILEIGLGEFITNTYQLFLYRKLLKELNHKVSK